MLTEKQKEAVKLLAVDDLKVQEVAARLGVHRCTIWRWKQKKGFYKEWEKHVNAAVRQWRKESGWGQRQQDKRRQLRQLEKQLNLAASTPGKGKKKKVNKAYDNLSKMVFNDILRM